MSQSHRYESIGRKHRSSRFAPIARAKNVLPKLAAAMNDLRSAENRSCKEVRKVRQSRLVGDGGSRLVIVRPENDRLGDICEAIECVEKCIATATIEAYALYVFVI